MDDADHPLAPPDDVPPVSAERLVDGHLPEARVRGELSDPADGVDTSADEPRRYPSTLGGAFYLLVLATSAVALGIVVWGQWRTGIRVAGTALVLAALVRLIMPSKDAGMLAVRSKVLDAVMLGGVGAAFFFLTATIPNQPG